MWVPMGTQPMVMPGGSRLEVRGSRWLALIGRLAPGASREQARAELDSIIEQMRTTWASQKPLHRSSRRRLHARQARRTAASRAAAGAADPDRGGRRSSC